jgi:hypothetical protein
MKGLQEKIGDIFVKGLVYFTAGWCVIALSMQVFFLVLHFSGNDVIAGEIANEMTIRIDGNYSDNPKNIWYKK